jgi:hypothetical protein
MTDFNAACTAPDIRSIRASRRMRSAQGGAAGLILQVGERGVAAWIAEVESDPVDARAGLCTCGQGPLRAAALWTLLTECH